MKVRPGFEEEVVLVTAVPQALLDYGADHSVVGEGEMTMYELVENLTGGASALGEIQGLVFRSTAIYEHTGRRPYIEPLDEGTFARARPLAYAPLSQQCCS